MIDLVWEPRIPEGRWSPAEGGYWYAEDWRHPLIGFDETEHVDCGIREAELEALAQEAAAEEPAPEAPEPDPDEWREAQAEMRAEQEWDWGWEG